MWMLSQVSLGRLVRGRPVNVDVLYCDCIEQFQSWSLAVSIVDAYNGATWSETHGVSFASCIYTSFGLVCSECWKSTMYNIVKVKCTDGACLEPIPPEQIDNADLFAEVRSESQWNDWSGWVSHCFSSPCSTSPGMRLEMGTGTASCWQFWWAEGKMYCMYWWNLVALLNLEVTP